MKTRSNGPAAPAVAASARPGASCRAKTPGLLAASILLAACALQPSLPGTAAGSRLTSLSRRPLVAVLQGELRLGEFRPRQSRLGQLRPAAGPRNGGAGVHLAARRTDSSENYVRDLNGGIQRWDHFPITVAFVHDSNDNLRREHAALAGFSEWGDATGGLVSYRITNDPDGADVTVHFDPDLDHGVTDTSYDGGQLNHAEMSIGLRDPDTGTLLPISDLSGLCAHEFGHALGINGHSHNPNDLMYATIDENCHVTPRDANTLAIGYGEQP